MFPFVLVIIPLFLVLKNLHLINSLFGLIMVYVVWSLPFALWMLVGYVRAVPAELEEAAAVDGAGRLRTLVSGHGPAAGAGHRRHRDVRVHHGLERVLLRARPAQVSGEADDCR